MASGSGTRTPVTIAGRDLSLSNLDKIMYPETGTTKAEVIDYYARMAPVLLPHVTDRPMTVKRYPDGVDGSMFYMKNAPAHRPDWIRTVTVASPGSTKNRDTVDYLVLEEVAALVWVANLAALELHTPMWRVSTGLPDLIVADLDPGPPAGILECARVAELLREAMDGPLFVKTSGSKGLQVYAAAPDGATGEQTRDEARRIADTLARKHPELVVSNMRKDLRPGKVLLDWSQNNPAKTTVSVYSLRARERPTVSTPVSWEELAAARNPADLSFTAADVLARVAQDGDLFAPLVAR
jgi:bifunctional non-homologous end joining protein LigD